MTKSIIKTVSDINTENVRCLDDVISALDILRESLGPNGIPEIQDALQAINNNIKAMQSCYNPITLMGLVKAQGDLILVIQHSILETPLNDAVINDIDVCKNFLFNFKSIIHSFKSNPGSYFPYLMRPVINGILSSEWINHRFQRNTDSIVDCVNALERTADWKIGLYQDNPDIVPLDKLRDQILGDLNTNSNFDQINLFSLVTLIQTYCAAINAVLNRESYKNDVELENELVTTMYIVARAMQKVSEYKEYYKDKTIGSQAAEFCEKFEEWFKSTGFGLSAEGNLVKNGKVVARDKKNIPAENIAPIQIESIPAIMAAPEVYIPGPHEIKANEIHSAPDFGYKIKAIIEFFQYRSDSKNETVSDAEWVNFLEFGLENTPDKFSRHAVEFDGKTYAQRMALLCLLPLFGQNYQPINFTKINLTEEIPDPIRMLEFHLNLAYQFDGITMKQSYFDDALQFFDDYHRPLITLRDQLVSDFDRIIATHNEPPSPALTSMMTARNTLNNLAKPIPEDFVIFTIKIKQAINPRAGLSPSLRFDMQVYVYEAWNRIREYFGFAVQRTEKTATLALHLTGERYLTKMSESIITRNNRATLRQV